MGNAVFHVRVPKKKPLPILISVPHTGIAFPEELQNDFVTKFRTHPPDTDWFVEELYNFADELGITLIYAHYSRYVIDLNRDPTSRPLYHDSRRETGLVPTTTFQGENLYMDASYSLSQAEIYRRLQHYYWPYYEKITSLLKDLRRQYAQVLFYDAHSIKRIVPSIRKTPFPDLILGDQDGKTAHPEIIQAALEILGHQEYSFAHNDPFKGGHLTRYFGKPAMGVHALQLEMSQSVYLDDCTQISPQKCQKIRPFLQHLLLNLRKTLEELT